MPEHEPLEQRVRALGDPNWTTPSVMAVLRAWGATDGITTPGSAYAYSIMFREMTHEEAAR